MKYLDEEYTKQKIGSFAQKRKDDFEWQMFMEGYLSSPTVYPDLYFLMRPHYLMALENKAFKERIDDRLVDHITLGYLYYKERLEENNANGQLSLFWKMLTEAGALGKSDRWLQMLRNFLRFGERKIRQEEKDNKEEGPEEIKKKFLEFWGWTYEQQELVKENLGDKFNSFLERLSNLTIFLDRIDEETEKCSFFVLQC